MTHYTDEEHDKLVFRLATSTQKESMEAIWRIAQIAKEANRGHLSRKTMIEHIEQVLMDFPAPPKFAEKSVKTAATTP